MVDPLIKEAIVDTGTRHCNTVGTGQLNLHNWLFYFSEAVNCN